MRCPNCDQENADTSTFCFECGARLKADEPASGGGQPSTTASPGPAPPTTGGDQPVASAATRSPGPPPPPPSASGPIGPGPAPAPPEATTAPSAPEVLRPGFPRSAETVLTHLGEVFGLGYGPGYYAVWDLRKAGEPVARFDTSPIGWEAAWRRFHELEREHGIPGWRRPSVVLILLHVAIGLVGLTIVQLFLIGFVLGLAGRKIDEQGDAIGWVVVLCALAGLVSWLLFVYLRRSPRVRWIVLAGVLGIGFALALTIALATQPAGTF